jgi:hypothetical protein
VGAWGVQPTENDSALDWLGEQVEDRLTELIDKTLRAYLDGWDDIEEYEAEAAMALLLDGTLDLPQLKYRTLNLRYTANVRGLWDLATRAVDRMLEEDWANGWNDPDAKIAALRALRADVERAREQSKDMHP